MESGASSVFVFGWKRRRNWQKAMQMDYFTTTLSISPMKNAQMLNEIGGALAKDYGISYLYSDFKKREGYKRSVELSKEYGMYRQDYCGCVFSYRSRQQEKRGKELSIMAQLWGGRFTKATDRLVYDFNASIGFDQRFFAEDIMGSKAHVKMLAKQGILTEEERDEILVGLEGIEKMWQTVNLPSHPNTRIFIVLWRQI